MKKTKEHIMYHTKRLAAHGKKVVHHSAKIAHKHRHILLGYMHVCLVVIGMYVFHMATSMYAQENGETIISQETMSMENILTQETNTKETNTEETNIEEEAIREELNIEETTENNELTWTVNEDWVFSGVTSDNETTTQTWSELTWIIESELTWTFESELTWTFESDLTWTIESELTWSVIEDSIFSGIANNNETIQTWSVSWELILPEINNPSDINWLQTWLDANKIESIELSGNYVTLRKDRRWSSSKAFSLEENKMPSLVPWVVNNRSAIYFDNIDDGMQTNIKLHSDYTLFIIYNKEHTPINFASALGSNSNWFVGFQQNNFWFFATGLINIPTYRGGNSFKVVAVQANNSGTQVFLNNQNITSETTALLPTQELTLGNIGEQETLWGYIAEIVVYESLLWQYEMTKIHEYFQRKYSPFISKWLPVQEIDSTEENISTTENENNIEEKNTYEPNITETEIETTNSTWENTDVSIETTNEELINEEVSIQEILENPNKEETEQENMSDFSFSRAFEKGEQHETIGYLQKFLTWYWVFNNEINNTYDETTIAAVFEFQIKEDLLKWQINNKKLHGYFGPSTRKKINKLRPKFIENHTNEENNDDEYIEEDTIDENETTEETLTWNTEEEIVDPKERFKRMLLWLGYKEEIRKWKEVMIGNEWFQLDESEWSILVSTIINKDSWSMIWEISFPENVIIKTENGNEFTGDLLFFDIESNKKTTNGIEIIESFKAGADEPIFLKDDQGNAINADIKVAIPAFASGQNIVVQYSHDGINWNYLDTIQPQADENGLFANFQTNHFTIFSLGIWTGTFVINNDAATTTGLNVTLNTNIVWATHMKFGNTPAARDSASRVTYNASYPRTLTGADGEKTVYAMFSGNGSLAYIQDTIYLNTTIIQESTGLQLHLDGSYTGIRFYDISPNNYLASGVNNVQTTTRWGFPTMSFNGSNQYINIAQPIITTYPFTISAWIKPDRVTGTQGIVFKGRSTAGNRYFGINLDNATFQITARNTTARTANGTIAAQAGQRYHVVGIFASATNRTIYVNGIQGGTSTNSVTLDTTAPQHRTIGKYAGTATNYFSGSIDEVRIYNKVLTSGDIQNLYIKKPSFVPKTIYSSTPVLDWAVSDPYMTINMLLNGNIYLATNYQNGIRKSNIINPSIPWGTYNVTLNYTNIYGRTGSTTYTNGLTVNPLWNFIYTPNTQTFGNVIATLTGYSNDYFITNNNWSANYTFTGNGQFIYKIQSTTGLTYETIAAINWIKKWSLTGTNLIFNEDELLNNGGIQNTISFQLSGDTFNSNAPTNGSITMSGIPTGLTPNYYLSGTQTLIVGLSWTATSHANSNDINNIEIRFWDWAFTNSQENEIINSTITGIRIDFLDPYVWLPLYPSADTMIDADTDVANGCGDWVCQEYNFWAMQYLCTSDFWSKVLFRFDPSTVPTGAKITSAKLRLTRYYISNQTEGMSFSLRPIVNNPGWIEGTKSNTKASAGEVNYKMRKREQESWYNGNIGMVNGVDYTTTNMVTNPAFTGTITSNITQEFNFNTYGLSMVQNRVDNPETNHGMMMGDSNDYWLCIRSKEYATVGERPMMTVTYAVDTDRPEISSLSPYNNETNVGLYNNLIINFNENIRKYTGYNITIKRIHNNSIFETIDAGSANVTINNNVITINHTATFENFTGYYVEIQSGAFRDIAGNSFTGFVGSGSWKFTTLNTQVVPAITGNTATTITTNSALATATITSTGSDIITERWFYRSTTNGFNDGAGTKISETGSRDTLGDFSLSLTGLPSGTWIYFKGFATNSYGSKFTQQSGFLTLPAKPTFKPATYIDNDGFRINRETTTGATSYKLRVSTWASFMTTLPGYSGKVITDTKENLTGLAKETRYYYKIQAINDAGQSEISNTQSTQTTWLPSAWSWLKFEEPSGSTTFDSSLNNNYGILLWGVIMYQTGVDGKAFQFDGINDEVSIVDFDHGPDLTVSFRFKTNSTGNNMHLYSHGDTAAVNSINVLLNNSDQTLKTFINGQQTILNLNGTLYPTLINNERHLYTLTIDDDGEIAGKKKATVYIDGTERITNSSIDAGIYNPTNNITLARRSANQVGTFYKGFLDDVRIYNKTLTSGQVYNLYAAFIDTTPPTAYVEYSPWSGTCYNGDVIATLTGYSENITVTNNGWSNIYTFTENNVFTFTFRDDGFNTGEVTATVDWICKEPVNIWWPAMVTGSIEASSEYQIVEQEFSDYFWINDPIWANSGYYTTIAISDLSGQYQSINKNTIAMKWTWITLLSWTTNPRVEINSNLNNYQSIWEPITYIKRDTASNYGVKGKYGNKPWLKFDIPAYITIDDYHATLTYTLYEN
jgi:hypothetical protein